MPCHHSCLRLVARQYSLNTAIQTGTSRAPFSLPVQRTNVRSGAVAEQTKQQCVKRAAGTASSAMLTVCAMIIRPESAQQRTSYCEIHGTRHLDYASRTDSLPASNPDAAYNRQNVQSEQLSGEQVGVENKDLLETIKAQMTAQSTHDFTEQPLCSCPLGCTEKTRMAGKHTPVPPI